MNNKGFTLVELLVTISLLAIISTLSVSVIANFSKQNKENNYRYLLDNIYNAAKLYKSDNRYNSGVTEVTLETLVNDGYLKLDEGKLINPIDNSEISDLNNISINLDTLKVSESDKETLCVSGNDTAVNHKLCKD